MKTTNFLFRLSVLKILSVIFAVGVTLKLYCNNSSHCLQMNDASITEKGKMTPCVTPFVQHFKRERVCCGYVLCIFFVIFFICQILLQSASMHVKAMINDEYVCHSMNYKSHTDFAESNRIFPVVFALRLCISC